jgi:hypothetical protein
VGWWRAGPVAGHGLRLRKLRLRGVSRATRPNIVFARPGSFVRVAVRGRDCLRGRSSCVGRRRAALCRGVVATVVCLRLAEPTGARRSPARLFRRYEFRSELLLAREAVAYIGGGSKWSVSRRLICRGARPEGLRTAHFVSRSEAGPRRQTYATASGDCESGGLSGNAARLGSARPCCAYARRWDRTG